jgi:ubiquinone/menaquinone biosynthesis C-methylase UbiE
MPSDINRLIIFDQFFDTVHRQIVNALKAPKDAQVLDVGGGAGGFARHMARKLKGKERVTALDIVHDNLLKARELAGLEKLDHRIRSVLGDVEALPFPDNQFDLIWCSRVVHHHLPEPKVALAELYRVLRSGGRLAIREDGGRRWRFSSKGLDIDDNLQTRLHDLYDRWFEEKHGCDRPDDAWWRKTLKKMGLKSTEQLEFPFKTPDIQIQLRYIDDWLRSFLSMDASGGYRAKLGPTDRWALERLTDPDLECGVLNQTVRSVSFDIETIVYVGAKP